MVDSATGPSRHPHFTMMLGVGLVRCPQRNILSRDVRLTSNVFTLVRMVEHEEVNWNFRVMKVESCGGWSLYATNPNLMSHFSDAMSASTIWHVLSCAALINGPIEPARDWQGVSPLS